MQFNISADAIIIGGGPAGCSCAFWLHELGFKPVLIEKQPHLGGLQAISPYTNHWLVGVPNRTGEGWAKAMHAHVASCDFPVLFSAEILAGEQTAQGFRLNVKDETHHYQVTAPQMVLATGVAARTAGLISAANILIGPGKHIERFDFKDKRVAILGGGDNAAENYSFVAKKGAQQVNIFARNLRARKSLLQHVSAEDIYQGPYTLSPETLSISVNNQTAFFDIWIVLYGWQANIPAALSHLVEPLRNDKGFVTVDANRSTAVSGLYAIGEVAQVVHPCMVTAMSDGVICAKAIEQNIRRVQ